MFKLALIVVVAAVAVSAKPGAVVAPVAYPVPAVAAYTSPVVTPLATSSQYVARSYNGIVASPYVAAPYSAAYSAYPYAAAYSAYPYTSAAYPYASAAYVV